MLRRILKFPLLDVRNYFSIPKSTVILHIAEQRGTPHMWAVIDEDEMETTNDKVIIHCLPTGAYLDDSSRGFNFDEAKYLGTLHINSEVWHYFAEGLENGK